VSALTEKPLAHGSRYAYVVQGCRCAACRKANTDYHTRYQQRRRERADAKGAVT
jgi:hypothetical protein